MNRQTRLPRGNVKGKKTRLLSGKGGLVSCPACGSDDITAYDRDAVTPDMEVNRVSCNKCGRKYTETWKAVDWREEAG